MLYSSQERPYPWQLIVSLAVPVYWRATPTRFSSFFRKPVSSTMSTPVALHGRRDDAHPLRTGIHETVRRDGDVHAGADTQVAAGLADRGQPVRLVGPHAP